jgi:hypothetical protein
VGKSTIAASLVLPRQSCARTTEPRTVAEGIVIYGVRFFAYYRLTVPGLGMPVSPPHTPTQGFDMSKCAPDAAWQSKVPYQSTSTCPGTWLPESCIPLSSNVLALESGMVGEPALHQIEVNRCAIQCPTRWKGPRDDQSSIDTSLELPRQSSKISSRRLATALSCMPTPSSRLCLAP